MQITANGLWPSLLKPRSIHHFAIALSSGQTDSQVVASWKLGSTCDSVWPGLACTCVDLRSLWSRSNLHASQYKFFTVWSPNASLFASSTCRYLRLLASPFDQGFRQTRSILTSNCSMLYEFHIPFFIDMHEGWSFVQDQAGFAQILYSSVHHLWQMNLEELFPKLWNRVIRSTVPFFPCLKWKMCQSTLCLVSVVSVSSCRWNNVFGS